MKLASLLFLSIVLSGRPDSTDTFVPQHRISGIGVARDDISDDLLEVRTERMIQAQTFGILRDPLAVPGAKRVTGPRLQELFREASRRSGVPVSVLEAIAYIESWGEPDAQSPAGPRGIMQVSSATAKDMGLKITTITKYRTARERVWVSGKGKKAKYRTVTKSVPYVAGVRDDRLVPERAIPAAAVYLAGLERTFGGRDWAIFAYHCGVGCVGEMQSLTRRARGVPKDQVTVARMFFSGNPAWNRELYEEIQQQMLRDFSPTYYFRIMRAEQLLALYRRDPEGFTNLAREYRSEFVSQGRAPHRLSVWLKHEDLVYRSCDDIRADMGSRLVRAPDRPWYYGYQLDVSSDSPADLEYFSQASPSAVGTLAYIAFETRRLHQEMKSREKFLPIPVVSLVQPESYTRGLRQKEAITHCSGHVFDIDFANLPPGEVECLRFVLSDLGWDGYLGYVEEGRDSLHIGCSPSTRDFFASIFHEAVTEEATTR